MINLFLFPLAAAIALAYNASRYEMTERILRRALRSFVLILVGMLVIFLILQALSWGL